MDKMDEKEVIISVRGLVSGFGSQVIHDGLDLDVYRGEVLGVVGGSGTGKSVLMRTILGLNPSRAGQISSMGPRAALAASQMARLRALPWSWSQK